MGPWAEQAAEQRAEWFMDYRNADGSIAEMCGNGIRVFARYLLDHGLAAGPELAIGTRAGVRRVRDAGAAGRPGGRPGPELTAEMGPAVVTGHGRARIGERACDGLAISVGNPHLACLTDLPVADFDLSGPPALDQGQFPDGANVEVLRVTAPRHVEMRVYERGSGATLSCGTGAVATAVAAAVAAGSGRPGEALDSGRSRRPPDRDAQRHGQPADRPGRHRRDRGAGRQLGARVVRAQRAASRSPMWTSVHPARFRIEGCGGRTTPAARALVAAGPQLVGVLMGDLADDVGMHESCVLSHE